MTQNLLAPWLEHAHAMEIAVQEVFESHAKQATDSPLVSARLDEHLEATRGHVKIMKGDMERLGQRVSPLKSGAGSLMGSIQAIATGFLGDPVLRNLLADYSAQKYQIAFYRTLILVATEMGDVQTAETAQDILREEEAMADWIERQLPTVAAETLRQKSAPS